MCQKQLFTVFMRSHKNQEKIPIMESFLVSLQAEDRRLQQTATSSKVFFAKICEVF